MTTPFLFNGLPVSSQNHNSKKTHRAVLHCSFQEACQMLQCWECSNCWCSHISAQNLNCFLYIWPVLCQIQTQPQATTKNLDKISSEILLCQNFVLVISLEVCVIGKWFPRLFSTCSNSSSFGIYCLQGSIAIPSGVIIKFFFKYCTSAGCPHGNGLKCFESSSRNHLQSNLEPVTSKSSTWIVRYIFFSPCLKTVGIASNDTKPIDCTADSKCSFQWRAAFLWPGRHRHSFQNCGAPPSPLIHVGTSTKTNSRWGTVSNASLMSRTKKDKWYTKQRINKILITYFEDVGANVSSVDWAPARNSRATKRHLLLHWPFLYLKIISLPCVQDQLFTSLLMIVLNNIHHSKSVNLLHGFLSTSGGPFFSSS